MINLNLYVSMIFNFVLEQEKQKRTVLHIRRGVAMLHEDVLDVVKPMRAGLAMFSEVLPHLRESRDYTKTKRKVDAETRAKLEYVEESLMTAFWRLTRAIWPGKTYWDLLPGTRRDYKPSRGAEYHKTRYHAFFR